MKIQLIRNATLWLEYAGVKILVDPMFSDAEANPPIINSNNDRRNPLVPLPADAAVWAQPDLMLVSHLHQDHFDEAAIARLPKTTPVVCQPGNEEQLHGHGFTDVTSIESTISTNGITIHRTQGQHGTGEIGQWMGQVSGFVLQAANEPTLYIAGDTIWCDDVVQALDAYHPDVTVVNAGGAQFVMGDPITMDAADVIAVCEHAPYTQVVAVHMDAINHCHVTRDKLRDALDASGKSYNVRIPEDGEWV
ncbi:MBL fold metallo-hydrolase [Paenibacillus guangzhouensis]|uniref:MBL fold metallo-hydrolase n=1 Tax=Paenibacillus guangzhouensis TaxID=1473112 RepID=UPI0012674BEC|nr:MBL fold metallo-hydrolase [Paenibacillus guangzhouensis]